MNFDFEISRVDCISTTLQIDGEVLDKSDEPFFDVEEKVQSGSIFLRKRMTSLSE